MSGLRVGIKTGSHQVAQTLRKNGIKQDAVFLSETLFLCHGAVGAVLVIATSIPVTSEVKWNPEMANCWC